MKKRPKDIQPKVILGMDISKYTIDIAALRPTGAISMFKIAHTEDAIRLHLRQQISEHGCRGKDMLICAEDMGLYCQFIIKEAVKKKVPLCLESPLQIKRSLGIARGKNDQIDAVRIAEYAKKNLSHLKIHEPPRECIKVLQKLAAIRSRLIKTRTILVNETKVCDYFLGHQQSLELRENFNHSVMAITEDIAAIDNKIDLLINGDPRLKRLFQLITSVPYIGKVIATQILIHTNEFKKISTARQFACYCGIAPFQKTSGGVTLGRPRVSFLANKDLKSILHIAAMGCLRQTNSILRKYYLRKQKEGKNNMLILNAIRNKLVHRIFSCVKHDTLYSENRSCEWEPLAITRLDTR